MPDLHAYRLPLRADGVLRFREAVDLVGEEVGRSAGVQVTGEQGSAAGPGATIVRWRMAAAPDANDRVWTLIWETPDPGDVDSSWVMTAKVGLDAGQAWVIVRLGIVTQGFRMSRVPVGVEPPPLVLRLVDALPAEEDGQALAAKPCSASDVESADALADLLLHPGRVLPVVVISCAPPENRDRTAQPLIDPDPVARALVGVAHVVVLDSTSASHALTARLGTGLTVFGGAVRLYWPGLVPTSERHHHMLWLPRDISDRRDASVRRALVQLIMPVAVTRFSSAALEARISMAVERRRRSEVRRLSARAAEASLALDWQDELEAAWSENERLREEAEVLSEQLTAARANLHNLTLGWAPGGLAPQPPAETSEASPSSVIDAVEWAARECPSLVFLADAYDSARRATYRQPARVLTALLTLDRVVEGWREGRLVGGFRNVLAEQGLDYGRKLSSSAVRRSPHEYEKTYLGKRIVLGPHLRLGRGSPEACCRIYFYLDEEARLCVVGHVGNHLSDRTTG